ncbi:D-alanine--D-alanine ligase [Atribacter laminatus]|uniref:D-alanine--D-alanine ligase n=1 Tax=Atribacter laminatus TaxID=2847778 RepID=A0A7T1F2G0_ATRLM|nr:D-alanine--D-alanine ligase [Atribacter laminatus]QPM67742.1 D-alanine--D-alanine ligase A [Atribacter laminatus]
MKSKIKVGILFGGQSVEHEISILSAQSIYESIDKEKYDVVLIGIDKQGGWHFSDEQIFLEYNASRRLKSLTNKIDQQLALIPGRKVDFLYQLSTQEKTKPVDVVFPVLHGTNGEDGSIQGFLKLSGIPFVGAGILGSAIGMDKEVTKRLLRDADIPIPHYQVVRQVDSNRIDPLQIQAEFGLPLFIKPANLGSSVGISKVKVVDEIKPAIDIAFLYDQKILIEECILGREIECSVLGNEHPEASLPGEIKPNHEFYSYQAKYLDENGANLEVPAKLPDNLIKKIQEAALKVFQVLEIEGMARVDFFLQEDGKLLVNEVNTIPGFTQISMYPKLWEASGLSYKDLITRLIELAIERAERDQKLKTTYEEY